MGLETDVAAQQTIQDSLQDSGNDNNTSFIPQNFTQKNVSNIMDRIRSIPTSLQQNLNYNAPSMFSGLPSLNVGGFNVALGPVGGNLGITATKTFQNGGSVDGFSEDDPDNVDYSGVDETGQDDDMDYTDVAYGYTTPTGGGFFSAPKTEMQRAKEIGLQQYSPVQNVPYDFFGFVKGAMNRHARDSLSKGYSPEFSKDAQGNITSVTGRGGPGMSIPGIGGLMSMIGANMGAVTTTGYAGKGVNDMNNPNDNGNDNELIRRIQPITPQEEYRKAITIYNQNPNRYTLRTR
jgi:hypothetical protein